MDRERIGILAHRHFMRDLPRELRPAVHATLQRLTRIERSRWHAAGVRVKKLEGFSWPVFEARLNDGDRLIFTFNRALSEEEREPTLHVVLWYAGHHDDAVRTAGRRMGLQQASEADLSELDADVNALGLTWDGVERLGGPEVLSHGSVSDADAYVEVFDRENREQLRGVGALVEISEDDIDRWAESQLDPLLHLTPQQRGLTRTGQDRPVFLRGGVGTGKTTVLLYRMLKLLLQGSIHRPVFLTYSRSLAGWCRSLFRRLPGYHGWEVEFTSLSGLVKKLHPSVAPAGDKRELARIWHQRRWVGDPDAAWRELRRMRGSAAFHGRQPMTGADLPAGADETLVAAYSAYRKHLGDRLDIMDLIWRSYEAFSSPKRAGALPFDAVFIDEAQDLTPVEWLVCILMGDRPELAFFCADEAQDVLDTRFTWEGVEAALKLIGHRAPRFSEARLEGNERNSAPVIAFLRKLSERFALPPTPECSGARPGPVPAVIPASRAEAERVALQAGCPILLDLGAKKTSQQRGEGGDAEPFWCLDLDGIKGLEFQIVPVWLPDASWPRDTREARRLYTGLSRAMHLLVVFTPPSLAPELEALGAQPSCCGDVARLLESHRELAKLDREAVLRWAESSLQDATRWVADGRCSWEECRSRFPAWAGEVSLDQATAWVDSGLCSWDVFRDRLPGWSASATAALAARWMCAGLCDRREFEGRIARWARNATLAQAVEWVSCGLCTWQDFRSGVGAWTASATRELAASWVHAGIRSWPDFRNRIPDWVPEATLEQATEWVAAECCTWEAFEGRIAGWFNEATLEVADAWVRRGACAWTDFGGRIDSWGEAATYEQAHAWVSDGLCAWSRFRTRIPDWVPDVGLSQAAEWVASGLCSWATFAPRIHDWIGEASLDQGLTWARAGLCPPAMLRDRVGDWAAALTFEQATGLVSLGCCRWGAFGSRIADWIPEVSLETARAWVSGGLLAWKDFGPRVSEWIDSASREEATEWTSWGLCGWRDFAARIPEWSATATFELADQWVEAGLADWKDFEGRLAGWAPSAPVEHVTGWRERGLISRQVARARILKK